MDYCKQFDSALDAGIAYAVKVLRDAGIETFESCDGSSGHCFPEPTVRFHGNQSEGFRALTAALSHALPVMDIRRYWAVIDGEPVGPEWEMTFQPARLATVTTSAREAGLIS